MIGQDLIYDIIRKNGYSATSSQIREELIKRGEKTIVKKYSRFLRSMKNWEEIDYVPWEGNQRKYFIVKHRHVPAHECSEPVHPEQNPSV